MISIAFCADLWDIPTVNPHYATGLSTITTTTNTTTTTTSSYTHTHNPITSTPIITTTPSTITTNTNNTTTTFQAHLQEILTIPNYTTEYLNSLTVNNLQIICKSVEEKKNVNNILI